MSTNHYLIPQPWCVSFSGGKTSGYMLWNILQAHGGKVPDGSHVVFANTGKEREETLTFIKQCQDAWDVDVKWVEWQRWKDDEPKHRVVTHGTASRNGEPFSELIRWKQFMPNPVARMCTQHLKVVAIRSYLERDCGLEHWTSAIGIRADEPRRWRIEAEETGWETKVLPLRHAGVTKKDVDEFWSRQPFNLSLKSWEGNCDLCFLKGTDKILRIVQDRPDLVEWWAEREREREPLTSKPLGARFRSDRIPYKNMLAQIAANPRFPFELDEDDGGAVIDCLCSD